MNNLDTQLTGDTAELIVLFKPESEMTLNESGQLVSQKRNDAGAINDLLKKYKAVIKSIGSKTIGGEQLTTSDQMRFFVIKGPANLNPLHQELLKTGVVDSAYIKSPAEDPGIEE